MFKMRRLTGVAGWRFVVAAVLAMAGGREALAVLPTLTVTSGLIYQLDATDASKIAYDGAGKIVSWASSQGSAAGFSMAPEGAGPTYLASGGGLANLPCVNFYATTTPSMSIQKLVQTAGGNTTPKCVFIMENSGTPPGTGLGGIWGRNGADNGIRFWVDNPSVNPYWGPANTHQLVDHRIGGVADWDYGVNVGGANGQPAGTDNYYWSDLAVTDSRQAWQTKNWGTLGAYNYNATSDNPWGTTALGNYFRPDQGRAWTGQIGEVLAFDRWLSDAERQQVEQYLTTKWLMVPIISVKDGAWSAGPTWDANPSTPVGANNYDVFVRHAVSFAQPAQVVNSLILDNANSNLTIAAGAGLTGKTQVSQGLLTVNGALNAPSLAVSGGAVVLGGTSSGAITSLDLTGGSATVASGSVATIGTVNALGGTLNLGGGTVGTLVAAGTAGVNLSGNMSVATVTISGASVVNTSGHYLAVSSKITMTSGMSIGVSGSPSVELKGADLGGMGVSNIRLNGGTAAFTGPAGGAFSLTLSSTDIEMAANTTIDLGIASSATFHDLVLASGVTTDKTLRIAGADEAVLTTLSMYLDTVIPNNANVSFLAGGSGWIDLLVRAPGSTASYHPGDVNGDGQVSETDFNILKAHYTNVYNDGKNHWKDGDLNGDGQVSELDFNILKANYSWASSQTPVTMSFVTVPEPVTLVSLLGLGVPMLMRRRARA